MPETTVITQPNPVTRPTFTEPISAAPSESVTTSTSTLSSSQSKVINTAAVTVNYGYQQTGGSTNSAVNYNNDYQIRDSTTNYVSGTPVTTVSSLTVQPATIFEAVPTAVTQPTVTTSTSGNMDFRVPAGYRMDEFGMLVPV